MNLCLLEVSSLKDLLYDLILVAGSKLVLEGSFASSVELALCAVPETGYVSTS